MLLSRESNGTAEIHILTLWESEGAIRAFVGDNLHAPVYRPGDEEFVIGQEPKVKFFDAELIQLEESPGREPELSALGRPKTLPR